MHAEPSQEDAGIEPAVPRKLHLWQAFQRLTLAEKITVLAIIFTPIGRLAYEYVTKTPELFVEKASITEGIGKRTEFSVSFGNKGQKNTSEKTIFYSTKAIARPAGFADDPYEDYAEKLLSAVPLRKDRGSEAPVLAGFTKEETWDDERVFTNDDQKQWQNDQLRIYLFGTVPYKGLFGRPRVFPFCMYSTSLLNKAKAAAPQPVTCRYIPEEM